MERFFSGSCGNLVKFSERIAVRIDNFTTTKPLA
jgi:hypothetical protein